MRLTPVRTRSLMPSTGRSKDRVAIKPSSHGNSILWRVTRLSISGKPKTVKLAGGGWVSHIASIAAIFIFWSSVAV
jgi:hypothetical protein